MSENTMQECIINPKQEKNDPQLPETGFLFINPAESHHAGQFAKSHQASRHFLYHSTLFVIDRPGQNCFMAGPAVGAPMAVMVLEKLIALGAAKIMIIGWCGSLNKVLQIGDVLLPTWGLSEEGVSNHYPLEKKPESSLRLRRRLTEIIETKFQVRQGPIWTTDAPYRETRNKIKKYGSQGILGVDMEFSALNTVAAFRGIELAGAMLVSDELYHGNWKPGFQTKSFRKQTRDFFEVLVEKFN